MAKTTKTLAKMRTSPATVRFDDIMQICNEYFGEPRQHGTSHLVYRTPWPDDPRVNIQKGRNGAAKPYQVRQVLAAITKLTEAADIEEGQDDER